MTTEELRKLYGADYDDMTDEALTDMDRTLAVLSGTLLDTYERSIFDGKTIQELANDH